MKKPRMQPAYIVIDDFYPDPDKVRADALRLDYFRLESDFGYNGFIARIPNATKRKLMAKLKDIVDAPAVEFDLPKIADFKALTRRQFKQKKSIVHYDLHDWSAVLSLSPPRKTPSFTTFWYHPGVGLDGFHDLDRASDVCAERRCKITDIGDIVDRDSATLGKWVETSRLQHVFNRLILFRGNMFHSSSEGFGSTVPTAKLTQTFFFNVKKG